MSKPAHKRTHGRRYKAREGRAPFSQQVRHKNNHNSNCLRKVGKLTQINSALCTHGRGEETTSRAPSKQEALRASGVLSFAVHLTCKAVVSALLPHFRKTKRNGYFPKCYQTYFSLRKSTTLLKSATQYSLFMSMSTLSEADCTGM